jgi:chromosomal replication initiator protein
VTAVPAKLNPRYTFPAFIVGRSNEAAYAAASAAAVSPGQLYNPILLAGATGLGKTHLAHAVTAEAAMRPGRTAVLLTADEFLRELAAGVAAGTPRAIVERLAGADVIVMDDVHVLDRHAAAQDALMGRFRRAHVASLGAPDWEHRVAILQARATSLGVALPPSVANHLAAQCESSVRELEGGLTRLLALAALDDSPLSLALARRAIPTRRAPGGGTSLGAQAVQEAVAAEWGVSPDALIGDGRAKMLAQPRRTAMLLCRELLSLSLSEIGAAFGDRDRSTVLSALARARGELEEDARLAERVERLRGMLGGMPAAG